MTRRLCVLVALLAIAVPVAADAGSPSGVKKKRKRLSTKQFARIELGRRLFFDPQVSRSQARSCASCHAPDHGWSDPDATSADDVGVTRRHSQPIIDSAFNPSAHWDGEFATVEALVLARIGTPTSSRGGGYGGGGPSTPRPGAGGRRPLAGRPNTPRPHGGGMQPGTPGTAADDPLVPTRRPLLAELHVPQSVSEAVAMRIDAGGRYKEGFKAAFGSSSVTLSRIARAIAAFVHSVESTESAFDRHRAGEAGALSPAATRGLALFEGKAGCNQCHVSSGERPLFTDFAFHNTGIAWDLDLEAIAEDPSFNATRIRLLRKRIPNDADFRTAIEDFMDRGRRQFTQSPKDTRAFKTPTLRDVARRGPFMHDGRFRTLHEVVKYYAGGCGNDRAKDRRLKRFDVTPREVDDLVAFLESLNGETRPGLATKRWSRRANVTRLQFEDSEGRALKRIAVGLVPVGDPIPDRRATDERQERATDATGALSFKPGARTHMRIVLPDELPLVGGELVPDTCRSAKIVVPVRGRMTFVVTFPTQATPPECIVGDHPSVKVPAGHPLKRTRFVRGGVAELGGKKIARYEGWVRSDVGTRVRLRLPGSKVKHLQYGMAPDAEVRIDLTDL